MEARPSHHETINPHIHIFSLLYYWSCWLYRLSNRYNMGTWRICIELAGLWRHRRSISKLIRMKIRYIIMMTTEACTLRCTTGFCHKVVLLISSAETVNPHVGYFAKSSCWYHLDSRRVIWSLYIFYSLHSHTMSSIHRWRRTAQMSVTNSL